MLPTATAPALLARLSVVVFSGMDTGMLTPVLPVKLMLFAPDVNGAVVRLTAPFVDVRLMLAALFEVMLVLSFMSAFELNETIPVDGVVAVTAPESVMEPFVAVNETLLVPVIGLPVEVMLLSAKRETAAPDMVVTCRDSDAPVTLMVTLPDVEVAVAPTKPVPPVAVSVMLIRPAADALSALAFVDVICAVPEPPTTVRFEVLSGFVAITPVLPFNVMKFAAVRGVEILMFDDVDVIDNDGVDKLVTELLVIPSFDERFI